jgi:hypothetical protein
LVRTEFGDIKASAVSFRARPIKAVLLRCIKGFLYTRDPKIDFRGLQFDVLQMDQFKIANIVDHFPHLHHIRAGDEIFECRWGIDGENPPHGLWLFMFYRASGFLVRHWPRGGSPYLRTPNVRGPLEGRIRPGTLVDTRDSAS